MAQEYVFSLDRIVTVTLSYRGSEHLELCTYRGVTDDEENQRDLWGDLECCLAYG